MPRSLGEPIGEAPHVEVLVLPFKDSKETDSEGYAASVSTLARVGDLRIRLSEQLGCAVDCLTPLMYSGRDLSDDAILRSEVTLPGPAARRAGKKLELSFDVSRGDLTQTAASLVAALDDASPLQWQRAAEALSTMGPCAISQGAYPALLRALGRSEGSARASARTAVSQALCKLAHFLDEGALSEFLVPELLNGESPATVAKLAGELAEAMKPADASPIVEALQAMVRGAILTKDSALEDASLWRAPLEAGRTLWRFHRRDVVEPTCIELLQEGDEALLCLAVDIMLVQLSDERESVETELQSNPVDESILQALRTAVLKLDDTHDEPRSLRAGFALLRLGQMEMVEAACVKLLREGNLVQWGDALAIMELHLRCLNASCGRLITSRVVVALDRTVIASRDAGTEFRCIRETLAELVQALSMRPDCLPSFHAQSVFDLLFADAERARAAAVALGECVAADDHDMDAVLEALYIAARREEHQCVQDAAAAAAAQREDQSVQDAAAAALHRLGSSLAVRVVSILPEDFAADAREIKISCVGLGGELLASLWVPAYDALRAVRPRLASAMGIPDYRLGLVLPNGTFCTDSQEGLTINELV